MSIGVILLCCAIIAFFASGLIIAVIKTPKAKPPGRGKIEKAKTAGYGGFMKSVVKVLNKITEFFNIIAIAALVIMLLLVCANVIMRYIFNNPIPGTYELTQALMICLTPCIAVNIMAKQCVWVDVATAKLGRIGQMIVDAVTLPFSVGIIGVMAWQGFNTILTSYSKGTYSPVMSFRLMEWPFRSVYFLAMLMATLAGLSFTIERFMQYKNGGKPVDKNEVDRAVEEAGDLSAPNQEISEGGDAE